jgi:uncharacterized protein YjdB
LSACGDSNTAPDATNRIAASIAGASYSLYDGAHGGSDRFYFLPPLVSNPNVGPENDRAVYPALTVTVCELKGTACTDGDPLVVYAPADNAGGDHGCSGNGAHCAGGAGIALDGNHYVATWASGDFTVSTAADYRVTVAASGVELGHVDVDVLNRHEHAKEGFIGLARGARLLIPFRVREGVIASVNLTPTDTSLTAGQTLRFTYTATDYSGDLATDRAATWTSSDPSVATIDQNGNLTAIGAGTTTVTLDVEGHIVTATVTVASAATTFSVSPASASLTLGQIAGSSATLTITAQGPNGPITSGLNPTWQSDNSNVTLAPSASGFTATVTGVTVGVSHVTVSLAGLAPQTVTISVSPAPNSAPTINIGENGNFVQQQLTPQAILGVPIPAGASYSYSSSDPSVVEVDPSTGLVTPRADGSATITLTVTDADGNIIGTQIVAVNPPTGDKCIEDAVVSSVRPLADHVMHIFAPGEQLSTTATGLPANWQSVVWTLGASPSPVSITAHGATALLIAGQTSGNVTLNARPVLADGSSGSTGTACLYVTGSGSSESGSGGSGVAQATPTRVVISPSSASLSITDAGKQTLPLHADVYDQNGQLMDAAPLTLTWASGAPFATVTGSGSDVVIQAQSPTNTAFNITASVTGSTANGTMTITSVQDARTPAPVPTSVAITPSSLTLSILQDGTRQSQTLTAVVKDQNGSVIDPSGLAFQWSNPSPGVSLVPSGNSAVVTAVEASTPNTPFTVGVTVGGAHANASVLVTDLRSVTPPPAAPVVTPAMPVCTLGTDATVTLTATPPAGGSVQWSLSNTGGWLFFTDAPSAMGMTGNTVRVSCKSVSRGIPPGSDLVFNDVLSARAITADGVSDDVLSVTKLTFTIYPAP